MRCSDVHIPQNSKSGFSRNRGKSAGGVLMKKIAIISAGLILCAAGGMAQVPQVNTINPNSGANSDPTAVFITGAGFFGGGTSADVQYVELNDPFGTALTNWLVTNDSVIANGVVPAGIQPGTYDVRVTTSKGVNSTSAMRFAVTGAPATGSIWGEVTYLGVKPGTMYVAAFSTPDFSGSPFKFTMSATVSPFNYTLAGLPDGTYYLYGVKDVDGVMNGPEPGDPDGRRILPVVVSGGAAVSNINFNVTKLVNGVRRFVR